MVWKETTQTLVKQWHPNSSLKNTLPLNPFNKGMPHIIALCLYFWLKWHNFLIDQAWGSFWVNFCYVCTAGLLENLPHYSLPHGQLYTSSAKWVTLWEVLFLWSHLPFVLLASQNMCPIIVYSVANYTPHLLNLSLYQKCNFCDPNLVNFCL